MPINKEADELKLAIERIKSMEAKLNKLNDLLPKLAKMQAELSSALSDYRALSDYYSSEDWFTDNDLHTKGILPKDLACGVLSEDLAYDCLGEVYQYALNELSLITRILNEAESLASPAVNFGK